MKQQFISFANQKGGVGKSSLTALMASYLHYLTKLNVAIIDADYPQYSIYNARKRDMDLWEKDNYFKNLAYNQFKALNKTAYQVIISTPDKAISTAREFIASSSKRVDIILFDLPGTVQSQGVLTTLSCMDHVFVPLVSDRLVLESSLAFAKTLNEMFVAKETIRLKNVFLFWNQVDARENNHLYEVYNKMMHEGKFNLLNSKIADTKRFRKEIVQEKKLIFRSTLFPASRQFTKSTGIENLFLEILKILL